MPSRSNSPIIDRILVAVAVVCSIAALIAFAIVMIATMNGTSASTWHEPQWVVCFTIAYWGLPLALTATIVLLVRRILANTRRREASESITS
ncbi:hypothetical protein JRG19_02235 [Pseudoclavibacter alba]|uniref:Multidrug ABC transporter ATPase n=1 Tax=Pseudoclavibacter albus TaxID=272241 RepID=A0ABT2HWH9_9MICO|nr:hypothetical protein [Pseudoclavibacter alba]MBN6777370.1 hypothetical protein [Pseudoclavibacter alba]MCT2042674.1 hypothetical protein [Pseudoclavibacter alba]